MEAPAAPPSMTFSTGVSMAQMGQYVSKPELCMTHTETLPVVNTAATSQAFSATMATRCGRLAPLLRCSSCRRPAPRLTLLCANRVANTLEQPAGATQWKTTSNSAFAAIPTAARSQRLLQAAFSGESFAADTSFVVRAVNNGQMMQGHG